MSRHGMPVKDRILAAVDIDSNGCWIWQKNRNHKGYGQLCVRIDGASYYRKAHRMSFEAFVGAIPEGLEIDHLCRVRSCVNPAHLEPVTSRENTMRGEGPAAVNAAKTACKRGHVFDALNTRVRGNGHRHCRTCDSRGFRKAHGLK